MEFGTCRTVCVQTVWNTGLESTVTRPGINCSANPRKGMKCDLLSEIPWNSSPFVQIHQAKIWLQADQEEMHVSFPIGTMAWEKSVVIYVQFGRSCFPFQLVVSNYRSVAVESKARPPDALVSARKLQCISACGCDPSTVQHPTGDYFILFSSRPYHS